VSTTEDQSVSGNVLTNDTDVDSGTLTVVSPAPSPPPTAPSHLRRRNLHLYTDRELQRHGHVHLPSYDGQAVSDLATVTITITRVNDAPVAGDDNFTGVRTAPDRGPPPPACWATTRHRQRHPDRRQPRHHHHHHGTVTLGADDHSPTHQQPISWHRLIYLPRDRRQYCQRTGNGHHHHYAVNDAPVVATTQSHQRRQSGIGQRAEQ